MSDITYTEMLGFFHYYGENAAFVMGSGMPVDQYDPDFLNSICDYFQKRMETESVMDGSSDSFTWSHIVPQHEPVIELIKNRDLPALHETLRNLGTSPLTLGMSDQELTRTEHAKKLYTFSIYDKLISICEASGVLAAFNPENPHFSRNMERNPNEYLDALKNHYRFDISAPKYSGGMTGIISKYGLYTQRDMYGLYMALAIADRYEDRNITICDIGGGVGHLTYYLHRLGYKNLTIVDLPTVSVVQMYFLGTNLGRDNGVQLLAPHQFTGEYDLVLNADSFIEMSRESATRYLELVEKNGKNLISFNQETGHDQFGAKGFRVCDITKMKRTNRQLSWVRKGWLFEEYKNIFQDT